MTAWSCPHPKSRVVGLTDWATWAPQEFLSSFPSSSPQLVQDCSAEIPEVLFIVFRRRFKALTMTHKALCTVSGPSHSFRPQLLLLLIPPFFLLWPWASFWNSNMTNQYPRQWSLPIVFFLWTDACLFPLWGHLLYIPSKNSYTPSFLFAIYPALFCNNIYHYLNLYYICITVLIVFLPIM